MHKFIATTEKRSQKNSDEPNIKCGKVDRKSVWRQVFIRNLSIKIKSSRAVLFPIEKAESCCESVITEARKTLIVQVAE